MDENRKQETAKRLNKLFKQLSQQTTTTNDAPYEEVPFPVINVDPDLLPMVTAKARLEQQGSSFKSFGHSLLALVGQTIEVVTAFGPLTGSLLAAEEDYLALWDSSGSMVLVPYRNIEWISVANGTT